MALSVVYFRIMHCLGRPHYVWGKYLYSVLEKVAVRVTVSVTVCAVRDDDERKGEGETRWLLIACSSRKAPRRLPGLTSPSNGRIAINNTICLLNIYTAEGLESVHSTPPRPKIENIQMKIYHLAGDQTPDLLDQRQTCYHLSQQGFIILFYIQFPFYINWFELNLLL